MPIIGIVASNVGDIPSVPTIGTATAGDTSATVAFTPGVFPGTTYRAISSPGGITATSSSSPITVTGLTNGTSYTFQVRAENAYGNSAYSSSSNSVTPVSPATVWVMTRSATTLLTSTNGTSWTERSLSHSARWQAYTNSQWNAYNTSSYNLSSDGISWNGGSRPTSSNARYGFGGGGVALVTGYGALYSRSTDGVNWTVNQSFPTAGDYFGGKWANGRFVVVTLNNGSTASDVGATSTNGTSWTQISLGSSQAWSGVGYGNGKWIATNRSGTTGSSSTNGTSWSANITFPSSQYWSHPAYGNGIWITAALGTNTVAYSTNDGSSWSTAQMPQIPGQVDGLTPSYGDGKFVIPTGNYAQYSTNGSTWTATGLPTSSNFYVTYAADGGMGS